MPTDPPGRRGVRQFQCRDSLWETLERMAADLDCSVDALINNALRSYARARNYPVNSTGSGPVTAPPLPRLVTPVRPAASPPSGPVTTPVIAVGGRRPRAQSNLPPSMGPSAAPGVTHERVFLLFNRQRITISSEQFVIGRGEKTADLPIRDENISRRHAAVVRQDGAFYIKDLGSTNGVEFGGVRIAHKRIDEGDVFRLCDHQLRFTYLDERSV